MKNGTKFGRTFRVALIAVVALCAAWTLHDATRAYSLPKTSPAWQGAARLRYNPPAGWIRHYLGDDRYKIVGGTWKVLSTQYDVYYHRANCPNMLRQSPGIVIGFNSAKDARDAGYRPDGVCSPDSGSVSYAISSSSGTSNSGTSINRTKKSLRITLADGKSTVLLPPSWKRTRSGAQTVAGYATRADTLQPIRGGGFIRFAFVDAPSGINAEAFLKLESFSTAFAALNASGKVKPAAAQIVKNSRVVAAQAGGLSGVRLAPKTGSRSFTLVGKGSKIYSIEQSGGGNSTVIPSFQPR